MKKTFFKSVVATAVVTAAMALSSVAVFAGTTVYNITNLTNTSISDGDVLTFSDVDAEDINITWAGGTGEILTGETYSGDTIEGVTFSSRIRAKGSDRTVSVTVNEGDEVDFYVSTTNSSDASRSDITYTLTNTSTSATQTVAGVSHTAGTDVAKVSFTVDSTGTYKLSTSKDRLTLFAIQVIESGSTKYDTSSFGTETGPTIAVPDTSNVTDSLTGSEVLSIAEAASESVRTDSEGAETNYYTLVNGTYTSSGGNITLSTATSNPIWIDYTASIIYMGGSNREINVTLAEGESVLLTGYVSSSTGRSLTLDGVSYEAPTTATDTVMTVSEAGTYTIKSTANVGFTAISIIGSTNASAPTVALTKEVDGTTITYTGTIADTEDITISGINFVYAPGYTTTTKVAAGTKEITTVYDAGSDTYQFLVVVDASKVESFLGLKAQVNLVTDAGTLYSEVDTYTVE